MPPIMPRARLRPGRRGKNFRTQTLLALGAAVILIVGVGYGFYSYYGAQEVEEELHGRCHVDYNNEFAGEVVVNGTEHVTLTAGECCQACTIWQGCNVWQWCGMREGCDVGESRNRPFGECWLKKADLGEVLDNRGKSLPIIPWTSGAVYSDEDEISWRHEQTLKVQTEETRLGALKANESLPLVFMDVTVGFSQPQRIEIILFADLAPLATENMRQLCSGERGNDKLGRPFHLKSTNFLSYADRLVNPQPGANVPAGSPLGGDFKDDAGGLHIKHDRKGLLTMASDVPNTNGASFVITTHPAPHLDGKSVVFGEVVSGLKVVEHVRELIRIAQVNGSDMPNALISNSGVLRQGSVMNSDEYQDVVAAEMRRIMWLNKQPEEERERLKQLAANPELPLVFMDIRIRRRYVGRMEIVLFAKDSPLSTENTILMVNGNGGVAPPKAPGAGRPYTYKGMFFYRIVKDFVDQAGPERIESPLGGKFRDDEGGLKLNHSRMGLLSVANIRPNENTGHFSIIVTPQPHLNGKMTVFGEVVDGRHIVLDINSLADKGGKDNNEHSGTTDVQVVDVGVLREGSYVQTAEYRQAIAQERARIRSSRQAVLKAEAEAKKREAEAAAAAAAAAAEEAAAAVTDVAADVKERRRRHR